MAFKQPPQPDVPIDGEVSSELTIRDPQLLAKFAEMVTLIPSQDDHAMERIFARILSASTWQDIDRPWRTTDVESVAGKIFRLNGARRVPSDYRDGLGFFLAMELTDISTGEDTVISNGSVAVIGQVVKLYQLKAIPCLIEFVVAERPTKDGYRPHHLAIHGVPGTRQADAT